jgi:hypothetical protein
LLSLVLSLVIGFQSQIRNNFGKALFHAYVSAVCMLVASSVVMPLFWGWRISDVIFCMSIALCGIGFDSSELSLIVGLFWVLFLLLMGLALWAIRKSENRRLRIWGQVLTILVFAAILAVSHYGTARAIGEALALGAMMSMP